MRIRALVAIVGLLLTTVTVDALAVTVKSVRLWRAPDNTRLVFDLSGPVQHSVFTLSAPDRLVIDINGATLAAPLKVATSNTPISSVRSAQRTPTDLRVVVDLKKSVTPRALPWRPMPSTATAWWSTCTTRKPMPSRQRRQPHHRPRCKRLPPRQRSRSRRPSQPSSCRRYLAASATSSLPSTPVMAARTRCFRLARPA